MKTKTMIILMSGAVLGWGGLAAGAVVAASREVTVHNEVPEPTLERTPSRECSVFWRCPADFEDGSDTGTPDSAVTFDDLLYFLPRYEAGDAIVDLDDGSGTGLADGAVTLEDLLYFLDRYRGGC